MSAFGNLFLKTSRGYTRWSPIERGKYRIISLAMRLSDEMPAPTVVSTRDGCRVRADLSSGMHTFVYFLGDYEPAISDLVRLLVDRGEVCIDAGANFGWYSILFHKLVGDHGQVHSFEPVPDTFVELCKNHELAGSPSNLYLNNAALAEKRGELTINLFAGTPSGHASLSDQGRSDTTSFACQSIALDAYLTENEIGRVDFVKVDIEGAELGFLHGSLNLFSRLEPPIIVMEMASGQTRNFGYSPNDLVSFISHRAEYVFYRINESSRTLTSIDGFEPDDIGANVLCIPAARIDRLDRLKNWLGDDREPRKPK